MAPFRSIFTTAWAGLSLGLAAATAAEEPVARSTFAEVANGTFGANPSGSKMFMYVPANLESPAPSVVVGIHWCHGSAAAYYQGTQWSALAEKYGFIVIYPQTPFIDDDACWDVASAGALTHDGGGDSNSIANMVTFVLDAYSADPNRVFVTGISSGAMMTNVMVAAYPELFAAGVIYAGVPPTCFESIDNIPDYWNSTCAEGGIIADQSYWISRVRGMYPRYMGSYPRLQIYHGDNDEILDFTNYRETIKLWTGIFGYDDIPDMVREDDPVSPFTKYVYGDRLQGIVGAGVSHNIPHNQTEDLKFFGLKGNAPTTSFSISTKPASSTLVTSTTTTSTSSAGEATQTHWGQCGGNSYDGPTACESPHTCTYFNDWYSQCL